MIDRHSKVGEQVFFLAVGNSSVTEVAQLLREKEIDVNCRNINGSTG